MGCFFIETHNAFVYSTSIYNLKNITLFISSRNYLYIIAIKDTRVIKKYIMNHYLFSDNVVTSFFQTLFMAFHMYIYDLPFFFYFVIELRHIPEITQSALHIFIQNTCNNTTAYLLSTQVGNSCSS